MNEQVNQVSGIQFTEFAKLSKQRDCTRNKFTRIAVIAYWSMNADKVFECKHYFIVPNPMRRQVKEVNGTALYQVLYKGQDDKWFFFYQEPSEDQGKAGPMKIGVVKNSPQKTQKFDAVSRKPEQNCEIIYVVSKMGQKGLLESYITELDHTSLSD